ncbi:MAG: GNAT family N-acetyltransferase [Rhodospirillaceae bacterium]|nr:GNAT family N-acetyltransferase [Rhodospirillaceae bacterium]
MNFDPARASIRKARPDDAPALAEVFAAAWNHAYRGVLPDAAFTAPLDETDPAWWWNHIAFPGRDVVMLAATDEDDDPVALAVAGPDRFADPNWAEIYLLYVMPGYQRSGIGRRLLQAAFRRMHDAGFSAGIVWSIAGHASNAFYAGVGGTRRFERRTTEWNVEIAQAGFTWRDLATFAAAAARPHPAAAGRAP